MVGGDSLLVEDCMEQKDTWQLGRHFRFTLNYKNQLNFQSITFGGFLTVDLESVDNLPFSILDLNIHPQYEFKTTFSTKFEI
jgi:hypothetical protein